MAESKEAWDRFESDVKRLAGELRRHYHGVQDEKKTAELNRSLEQLKQAANAVFNSLDTAAQDPEVHSRTKQAARAFGSALAETFREVTEEVEKALRKPTQTR
jgi:hypothetical protein